MNMPTIRRHLPCSGITAAALLLASAWLPASAEVRSWLSVGSSSQAPGQRVANSYTSPPGGQGLYNQHSVNSAASGPDPFGNIMHVGGSTRARSDVSQVSVSVSTEVATGQGFVNPSLGSYAASGGEAAVILQFSSLIGGTAGQTGMLSLSGSLFGGGSIDSNNTAGLTLYSASNFAIRAMLYVETGCAGPACVDSVELQGHLEGPANYYPLPSYGLNYTLQVPVKAGDRVGWAYNATADANASYSAWAGTTPQEAGLQPRAVDGSSFEQTAQQLVLTGGLTLLDTQGLTDQGHGVYGFGTVAAVPEASTLALMLGGLAFLLSRRSTRAAARSRLQGPASPAS